MSIDFRILGLLSIRFFKPKEFIYKVPGAEFFVRKNTSDIYIIKEIFGSKEYGEEVSGVVFDIGANIGVFSVYASAQAERVFAFEPEQSNFKQLLKNIELNDLKNIKTYKLAIGGHTGHINLSKGKFNKGASSTTYRVSDTTESVEICTFAEAVRKTDVKTIDFLKIDIEGGEYELLENIPKIMFENIEYIILEYHHVKGRSHKDLVRLLEGVGYKVTVKYSWHSYVMGTGIIMASK